MTTASNSQTRTDGSRLTRLLVGQERACRILDAMLERNHFPPFIFIGQAGVGKRTAALRLAQAANCEAHGPQRPCGECRSCRLIAAVTHPDQKFIFPVQAPKSETLDARIAEVSGNLMNRYAEYALQVPQPVSDARLQIPIDAIRWLRREVARPPVAAARRLIIILQADRMNEPSANALLKTLEEPQERTTFVLTTDAPSRLPDTIRSRCQTVRFADIPVSEVATWLAGRGEEDTAHAAEAAVLGQGSLGAALRALREPDAVFAQPVMDCFIGPEGRGESGPDALLGGLKDVQPATAVRTLLMLVREGLRVKLGMASDLSRLHPGVARRAESLTTDYLRRALKYVLGRADELRLNTNPLLFSYTLLAALRSRVS